MTGRVLLYTPMNPPNPRAPPSGDRAMAGLIARALETLGYAVENASSLRSYEGQGNTAAQADIAQQAKPEIDRLVAQHQANRPALWLTYMNYYKAPDHLGPEIARRLNIPYVIAEASYAEKRVTGDFAAPHAAAKAALQAANAVFAMTRLDKAGLSKIVPPERLHRLPPFIDTARFPPKKRLNPGTPIILTVAMLRPGKKMANFPLIAAALARLADLKWTWLLVGDGEGRAEVETLFRSFPKDRVLMAGRYPPEAMSQIYHRGDLYLWPGLREAYGLSYLEAQASGVPVVACDTHGVPAVVEQGRGGLLSPAGDPDTLAQNLRIMLANRPTREIMGEVAAEFVHGERTVAAAAARLRPILAALTP